MQYYTTFLCHANYTMQATRGEVKIAIALLQHNIPLAFTDHLNPPLIEIFPDLEIAHNFALAST